MITSTDTLPQKTWLQSNKWLILRRLSQSLILALFLAGPLTGIWLVKGNLNSSLTLNTLPLTDPYILLQSVMAGHLPKLTAISGAIIVAIFYLLVGGRVYCSWVCPINIVTDIAAWLRNKLQIKGQGLRFKRANRYWLLVMTFILALVSGSIVWELVNPVSLVFRGLVFGMGLAWMVLLGIFLLDLFVSRRAWCGHLCPVGAFYSLPGRFSVLRVSAANRKQCNDCMDCFTVCPEPQVIKPALKGAARNIGPVILSANCTNCARCIDVCNQHVFKFSTRFNNEEHPVSIAKREAIS